jgi:pilus assembly protein CpaB
MDGRKIILLVGALIVAAITAFMARSLMTGSPAPIAGAAPVPGQPAPVDAVEVLVATKALPVGTILGPDSIKFVAWPKDLVEGAYFKKEDTDLGKLQGTVVRFAIPAGQPLTQGALVKPGDRGFLAAALAPGMRAVTVPVSAQAAVAGFIFPGDRVDLILTQTVAGGGDGPPLKASETVLRNLRVLATDQRTDKQQDDQGKTVVAHLLDRDGRGDAAHRGEDRGRSDAWHAVAVAALDRRQWQRAGTGNRIGRSFDARRQ